MKTIVGITLRGAGLALALTSVQACAQPVEQAATATRAAQTAPAGLTRQAFLKRQAERLLARDTDGDGMVSQAEFLAAGASRGPPDALRHWTKMPTACSTPPKSMPC